MIIEDVDLNGLEVESERHLSSCDMCRIDNQKLECLTVQF